MFGTSSIIESLSKDKSLEYKKLCKILKLTKKEEKVRLDIALNALEELEIISKNDNNEYFNNEINNHLVAKIRCSSKGYCFAVRDDSNDDIYIKENLLNYAWNGDKVLVRIIKEGVKRRSPEGIVDCILERNNQFLLAKVEIIDESVYGVPIDDRILSKILLPKNDIKFLYNPEEKNIVKIEIDIFPIGQLEGKGHVINELKLEKDENIDNEFVLTKNNINHCEKKIALKIIRPEVKERLDLTSKRSFMFNSWKLSNSPLLPIFHVDYKEDNQIELWIHANSLAERIDFTNKDVFDFFKLNTESYPLANEWSPFLCEDILKASQFKIDKKNEAISLCIKLSKDLEIIDYSFHLTYVKCKLILDEKHLEALVNRKSKTRIISRILKPLKESISDLDFFVNLSTKFRNDQLKKGKIEITEFSNRIESISEYYVHSPANYFNEYLSPLNSNDSNTYLSPILYVADSIWFNHSKKCKLANASFYSQNLDYLNINELIKQSNLITNDIELDEDGTSSLNKIFNISEHDNNKRILHKYLINSLKNNEAISLEDEDVDKSFNNISGFAPWTLGSYDYINLINQYTIFNLFKNGKKSNKGSIEVELLKKDSWELINWNLLNSNNLKISKNLFNKVIIQKCNENKSKLQNYKSNMINLKQIREAEKLIGNVFKGLITTVQSYGFFVELSSLSVEGLVHVSTLNDDWYEYRSRQNMLVGRKSKNTHRVGDEIKIKIIKVDILKYQIDLEIVTQNQ